MKIVISAGETSGDVHGAYLVSEIKKINPDISFIGMGSEQMKALGVDVRFDLSPKGTIGIMEVIPNIASIYSTFLKMKNLITSERPDVLLLVDFQGFNVPLAEYAKEKGIRTIYYIPPHEWLWGTKKNLEKIAKKIDLIISIFNKEHQEYLAANGKSIYFGHPLLDIVKPVLPIEERRKRFREDSKYLVCLCPGSRKQEIRHILPILIQTAKAIKEKIVDVSFCVLSSSWWVKTDLEKYLSKVDFEAKIVEGLKYDLLSVSDLAIAASGTINLEASILGTPNIMVYTLNPLTCFIGKVFLKIDKKMKYFSMPNILLNDEIVPEFVQGRAKPEIIAKKSIEILKNKKPLENEKLLKALGISPVISNIAQTILNFIRQ